MGSGDPETFWVLAFHKLADPRDPTTASGEENEKPNVWQSKLLSTTGGTGARLLGAMEWGNLFRKKVCTV